jgi:hypothetical protein
MRMTSVAPKHEHRHKNVFLYIRGPFVGVMNVQFNINVMFKYSKNILRFYNIEDATVYVNICGVLKIIVTKIKICRSWINPFRWFSCSRRFSWSLTVPNPIFLSLAYSTALIYFERERGWWITGNYPTLLKEKNGSRRNTTCAICWLKSVLHEEKRREQENHNVGLRRTLSVSVCLF